MEQTLTVGTLEAFHQTSFGFIKYGWKFTHEIGMVDQFVQTVEGLSGDMLERKVDDV